MSCIHYHRIASRASIGIIIILAFLITGISATVANGQEATETPAPHEVPKKMAPVKVDGNVLFYVHGITSYPAEDRAAAISKRIIKVAADRSFNPDSLKVIVKNEISAIYAGKEQIMFVYNSDGEAEGIARPVLAELFTKRIHSEIISFRLERSGPVLLKKSLYAVGAAVLLVAIMFVLLWLLRKLNRALEKRVRSKIDNMEHKSFNLIRSSQLWKTIQILFKTLRIIVIVVIIAVFLQYILGLFPWTTGIAAYTLDLFLDPVLSFGKAIINFLPSLGFLIVIYLVTRYLLKLMKLLFKGIHEGGITIANFDHDWAMPTFKILRLVVIVFALVIAYPYIPGSETSAFKGISVFLGVLISLGSSSFISNIIAGYSMTYRGAFKIGDFIEVGEHMGFVEEQRLLVTRLRSRKNEDISIPNSVLLNSNIVNYSKRAKDLGLILHTTVGIGYETPWRLVDSMLKEAADRSEGILKQPPPFVLKKSLDTFCVTYQINAYCDDASKMFYYYTLLHQNILDVFNENGVQIMTPAYEGDPAEPKIVPKAQWEPPLISNAGNK